MRSKEWEGQSHATCSAILRHEFLTVFIPPFIFLPMAQKSPTLRLGSPLSLRVGWQLGSISDVLHARARQQRTAAIAGRSPPPPTAARSCQSAPCLRARRLSLSVLSSLLRAHPFNIRLFLLSCFPLCVVASCMSSCRGVLSLVCAVVVCPFAPPSFQRDFPSYPRSCCSDLSKLE